MDLGQPSISNTPTAAASQHYLAEIKYPNIPNPIEIDKIYNVLHKIRTTTRTLFYKWQPLNKPKHGEIYLEQKYPVTRDPISGDQFSIVDDGYLWSSIPKPEIQEHQGQQIEVYKWMEGYSPGDKFFTISKVEYRLKTPNNILFLIHYLEIKNPSVPVRTALPATKISPIYLQQQFFQQLKQQMASMRRSPSPGPAMTTGIRPSFSSSVTRNNKQSSSSSQVAKGTNSTATNSSLNYRSNSNSTASMRTTSQQIPTTPTSNNNLTETTASLENSIDIFDSFGDFEAAFYRLNVIKPLLRRLFETNPSNSANNTNSQVTTSFKTEIEMDLIAATRKSISTTEDRIKLSQKNHENLVKSLKADQERFWNLFNNLLNDIDTETDLSFSYSLLQSDEMEIDEKDKEKESPIYTSI